MEQQLTPAMELAGGRGAGLVRPLGLFAGEQGLFARWAKQLLVIFGYPRLSPGHFQLLPGLRIIRNHLILPNP